MACCDRRQLWQSSAVIEAGQGGWRPCQAQGRRAPRAVSPYGDGERLPGHACIPMLGGMQPRRGDASRPANAPPGTASFGSRRIPIPSRVTRGGKRSCPTTCTVATGEPGESLRRRSSVTSASRTTRPAGSRKRQLRGRLQGTRGDLGFSREAADGTLLPDRRCWRLARSGRRTSGAGHRARARRGHGALRLPVWGRGDSWHSPGVARGPFQIAELRLRCQLQTNREGSTTGRS